MSVTIIPASGSRALLDDLNPHGPIIVATDGTASADGAIRVTARLARHADARVHVLAVLEPLPLVGADYGGVMAPAESEEARRAGLLQSVERQVEDIAGANDWSIEVRVGDPATVIAQSASERQARVIIAGIGHHDLLDRVFGGEVALHTLRQSRVPVLAVATDADRLPERVVMSVDFSIASLRAAVTALALFDTLRVVYLVHVAPQVDTPPGSFAIWMSVIGESVGPAFERARAELPFSLGVTVETVTLRGKPSRELLEFSRSVKADLIVTGSRGAGLLDRLLLGSTATGLVRGAQCSVLAVPAAERLKRILPEPPRITLPEDKWAEELMAFTRRHAGRRASLAVDDLDLGAQAQEYDYLLLGVDYDHHDHHVEIMLGDFEGTRRHLTRGIPNVKGIELIRDELGRDWILCVAHGNGKTMLTLHR